MNKIDIKDCTFIIPYLRDSIEREENLFCVTKYLNETFDTKILIVKYGFRLEKKPPEIESLEIASHDDYFHRTRLINDGIKHATTKYICICDTDVIFKPQQLFNAYYLLKKGVSMVYPYAGNFINIERSYISDGIIIEKESFALESVGGAVFLNKEDYTRAGLENENYISWCPDDVDRHHRMKTLGFKIERTAGNCYHIAHPPSPNSGVNAYTQQNNAEYEKIKQMNAEQLKAYIKTWHWTK